MPGSVVWPACFKDSDHPLFCHKFGRNYCEAGMGPFEFNKLPSAELYEAMLSKSPIIYAHKVCISPLQTTNYC